MLIAQNKLVSTSYFKEDLLLVSEYKGRINLELAKEQAGVLLNFYANNTIQKSIIDITKLYGSFAKLMEYYKIGYPVAVKGGLRYLAYVVSDDIINKNLIAKMCILAESFGVETQIFNSLEEAKTWAKKHR